mgnify:CR=1 FL=1
MIQKILALILIISFSPLLLIISLAIVINDGFPIIYNQKSYGRDGKEFNLYKFRTMKINTPKIATENFDMDSSKKYVIKIGRFLRKFSLDELPQLFNVLYGQMLLVGPRPGMTENENKLHKLRESKGIYNAMPGITGWAQVNGRDANTTEEKVNLDLYYIKNWNLMLDIYILIRTIFVVLFQKVD